MSTSRLLAIVAVSFVLAYLVPITAGPAPLAAAAVLAAILMLCVVLQRSLKRRDDLTEWIAIELNKLRRIYHLGKNLGGQERLRQWFTDLHGNLYGYLTSFDKKSFAQYQETNGAFRKLSYQLYQIPTLETEKERVLYRDLLEAAGMVAGARQRIQELWSGAMPSSAWNALTVLCALAGASVLFSMGPSDRLVAGLLLSVLGIGATLVRQADALKDMAGEALTKRYVENIARLELRRE
jgi:hypothetical protein